MRICILLLVLLPAANVRAQVPAPAGAQPDDRLPAGAGAAPRSSAVPAGAQEKRNWLLARLIVDQNFDREKIHSIEQYLAQMSPAQLDVLVQVYQERLRQREATEQSQLDEARANLEQMKAYRNALAQDVDYVRAFRQAQYLNFGMSYGRFGGGLGYGGLGYGGVGYGGLGYGGLGYGPSYPYPAYGYGAGMPAYGMAYPAWGGAMSGMGAGY